MATMQELEQQYQVLKQEQEAVLRQYDELRQSDESTSEECQALLYKARETIGSQLHQLQNEIGHVEFRLKTVAEISLECGVHRTTLNKAIDRGAIPARKSGDTWLIDTESEQFKVWYASRKRKEATN